MSVPFQHDAQCLPTPGWSPAGEQTAGQGDAGEVDDGTCGEQTSQEHTPGSSQPTSTSSAFFPHDKSNMAPTHHASSSTPSHASPNSSPVCPERSAFGHAGLGGSTAFCDPQHNFALAVTVNHLSARHEATSAIVRLVCSELGVPVPMQYDEHGRGHENVLRSSGSDGGGAGGGVQDTPDSLNA
ncbi:unnamed protein product [Closterium sp. NIES-54]